MTVAEALRKGVETLRAAGIEEAEIDAALHEAESRIGELEKVEDFEYYKAIYDEYVEGREYVEELLSGN